MPPSSHRRRSIPKPPLKSRKSSVINPSLPLYNAGVISSAVATTSTSFASEQSPFPLPSTKAAPEVNATDYTNNALKANRTPSPHHHHKLHNNDESNTIQSNQKSILFKSILLKRRDTLTFREQSYLESLVNDYDQTQKDDASISCDGSISLISTATATAATPYHHRRFDSLSTIGGRGVDDDDLNTAMMVLADDTLFPKKPTNAPYNDQIDQVKAPDEMSMLITIPSSQSFSEEQEDQPHPEDIASIEIPNASCSFTLPFTKNNDDNTTTDNNQIQQVIKEEKDKVKKRLGLFHKISSFSTIHSASSTNTNTNTTTPTKFQHDNNNNNDSNHDDTSISSLCNSFENVEIIEMAGKPIVLQDCQPTTPKKKECIVPSPNSVTDTTPTSNDKLPSSTISTPLSVEFTPTRSNRTSSQHPYLSMNTITKTNVIHPMSSTNINTNTNAIPKKTNHHIINPNNYKTPVNPNRSSSSSSSMIREAFSIGSTKRMSRVMERKNSLVHAGMWKAHRSGISTITTPPLHSSYQYSSFYSTSSSLGGAGRHESPYPSRPQLIQSSQKKHYRRSSSGGSNACGGSNKNQSSLPRSSSARRRAYRNHQRRLISNTGGDGSTSFIGGITTNNGSTSQSSSSSLRTSMHQKAIPPPLTKETIGSCATNTTSSNKHWNNSSFNDSTTSSLLSFPGIKEANPLLGDESLNESNIDSAAFVANESLPPLSMNEYGYGSSNGCIRQANTIDSPAVSLGLPSNKNKLSKNYKGLIRHLSAHFNVDDSTDDVPTFSCSIQKGHHTRNSSVEFLDLATTDTDSVGFTSQKFLDLQIGRSSTNSILLDDHPLKHSSRTSLQSLDLAQIDGGNSSLSIQCHSESCHAESSKSSLPPIRKADAINHYSSSNSVLETIFSEEAVKIPLQNTTNMQANYNLQAMRGKSLMSFTSSKASLDDSFLTMNSSSNLWMKPGIAFDESDLRSCKSDDTSVYCSDHQSLKTPSTFPAGHIDDDLSWDGGVDENEETKFDPWNLLVDEYEEYGYGLQGLPFQILGTSGDDEECQPHVLSPPLMESLFQFLPNAISEENFWIKYSLLRDGAHFFSLLQNVRGSKSTLIAIETVDGEVFGSFTNTAWRKNPSFFGSGEAFLWRMRNDRKTVCKSILDQARLESEIEVFPWTGSDYMIQLCNDKRIAIGGSAASTENAGGFGLCIDDQVLHGTSSHCSTFDNPPLSKEHQDGSPFEIVNVEVWTLTPSMSEEEAEKLEFGRLFLELHRQDQ